MRLRRYLVAIRLTFLLGGHILYLVVCGLLQLFGNLQTFGHSLSLGLWSLCLISLALLLMELIYEYMCPSHTLRCAVRKNGVTVYGVDGPAEHHSWSRVRLMRLETDRRRPEFRTLILMEAHRFIWLSYISRARIPLPENHTDELQVVAALHSATEAFGFTWSARADGTITLSEPPPSVQSSAP